MGRSAADVLAQLPREVASTSLLKRGPEWISTSLSTGRSDLPAELRRTVLAGQPARQRVTVDGSKRLAIGIPLPGNTAYFELFPLGELDADVSHELRNPLTTMVNAVALLEAHHRALPGDAGDALDLLAAEMHRFERLVSDLLEISRPDVASADVSPEPVRPADLVEHSVPSRLQHCVAPSVRDVLVRTDKRRLERVVANLVDNAESHGAGVTPGRGGAGR